MSDFSLRLFEDRIGGGAWLGLPACPRVLYVRTGEVVLTHGGTATRVGADRAWHGSGEVTVTAQGAGAVALRYELARGEAQAPPTWPGVASRPLLAHPIALDPATPYLMRCDRVDFDPGGEALPHGHRGGGIRCLIAGEIEVRIAGRPGHVMKPGEAWFESGVEPVHAIASRTEPTAFIRVSILPRELRGKSSIVYVDPAHAAVKPRKYTMLVDDPIEP
jgi:hypothetical protein